MYWLPIEAGSVPINGDNTCYKDLWWVYVEGRGVLFYITEPTKSTAHKYPQCNPSKDVAEAVYPKMYKWPEELGKIEIRQVPLIFEKLYQDR